MRLLKLCTFLVLVISTLQVAAEPGDAPWVYSINDWVKQKQIGNSDYMGYTGKTTGVLAGINKTCGNDDIGFGLGATQTRNIEYTNRDFNNRIFRYHGLLYGKHNWQCHNYLNWLLSASYNETTADKPIFVSRDQVMVATKYNGYTFASNLERGKGYHFLDHYVFTPRTYIQYVHLDQPTYKLINNNTAWRLDNLTKNYLTLGIGANLNWPTDAWQCVGMREIRLAFTYDALSDTAVTNANYVATQYGLLPACAAKRYAFIAGASFTYVLFRCLDLSIHYDFTIRSKFTDNIIVAKLKYNIY